MAKEKILFCWSGGKDSMMALHEITRSGLYDVEAMLTTLSEEFDRVCMHGVRRTLHEKQVASLNLKLHKIPLSPNPSNDEYESKMAAALSFYKAKGIRKVAFGDLFLEDLKAYRDKNLARLGMEGLYPIWKRNTKELILSFIQLGYKAVVVCVDTKVLDGSFSGRLIDESFVNDLPTSVDPCGENGEFHSFVYDGPLFSAPLPIKRGEKILRGQFMFSDFEEAKPVAVR
jgi:uncharacterized protein (TIGR00290 family)